MNPPTQPSAAVMAVATKLRKAYDGHDLATGRGGIWLEEDSYTAARIIDTVFAPVVVLLRAAACPNCDGGGSIAVQTNSRQLVTREMAMDACDPSMEGLLYSEDQWEQQQCQWCAERAAALAAATVTEGKE